MLTAVLRQAHQPVAGVFQQGGHAGQISRAGWLFDRLIEGPVALLEGSALIVQRAAFSVAGGFRTTALTAGPACPRRECSRT